MSIRIFRKAFALLIIDIVIIIGIFVLQFRTDSSIIEKIGNLQITLEQVENQQNAIALKNKFLATYNGLSLYCDDQHPVQIKDSDGNRKDVVLENWTRVNDNTCRFNFSENVAFIISMSSGSSTASLSTMAILPSNVSDIYVPYSYSYNMKIQKNDGNRIIFDNKKNSWETTAHSLADNYINMNKQELTASYSVYEVTVKFTFDSITDLVFADEEVYNLTLKNFKENLISAYKSNNSESSITESAVVAYIAAMAENGNYAQAIEDIPQSFKKSKSRTYLSAPYLNTLETMNEQLDKEILNIKKTIADASTSTSLEIFNSRNLASRMSASKSPKNCTRILERAAAVEFEDLTLSQATGILQTYAELTTLNPDFANILVPALDKCVERITDSCSYDGSVITISENDTFLSVVQAVETGIAVLRYGMVSGNGTLVKAGRVLINSYLSESSSFDLRTLSNIYPLVAYDNPYYPRYVKIKNNDGRDIWAWTAAKSITYEKEADTGSIILNVEFPEGLTHYLIIKGVPRFTSIYIYNMAFRTDPRFETYNSSGYVFKPEGDTLLLKSRQKSDIEVIKFEYDEGLAKRRAEEAERAAEEKAAAEAAAKKAEEEAAAEPEAPVQETPAPVQTQSAPAVQSSPANNSQPNANWQYQQQYQNR